ncbi:MAG: IS1595 family transposase [Rhodospirillales bacterium]
MFDLTNPIFTDPDKAREHLEATRWPHGPFCPHCGEAEDITPLKGKAHRKGLHQCNSCRKQFSVTVGTVFERSKVPLNKWLAATYLMSSSKKGISAHQIHRILGITYKTAWFMCHRIREAMKDDNPAPMGGGSASVEVDETYIGTNDRGRKYRKRYPHLKDKKRRNMKVVSLVERDGEIRSFKVDKVNSVTVQEILFRNIDRKSHLLTDESPVYFQIGGEYFSHQTVNHGRKEYARGFGIHVNTLEGYFSIFKRGMKGVYQHCQEKHLQRYLCEFDFRYNNRKIDDDQRTQKALEGIAGKRLTYRRTGDWSHL